MDGADVLEKPRSGVWFSACLVLRDPVARFFATCPPESGYCRVWDNIPMKKMQPLTPNPMKDFMRRTLVLAALSALTSFGARAADNPPGYVDFGKFTPPSSGGEFVEVHIKSNLIAMVARLAEKSDPDVAELLRGLQLVRVNVVGLDDGNRGEMEKRVKNIRAELDSHGWERVVTAQQKDQDVGVYLKTRGQEAVEGLVVTVIDGNHEAVLVNIVGDIKPEKIAVIGEKLNIEPLKKIGKEIEKK